jgi:Leucine-rich repeat (LRR) protein
MPMGKIHAFRCESLERLVVSNNQIEELPHELGALNKLQVLDVNGNVTMKRYFVNISYRKQIEDSST